MKKLVCLLTCLSLTCPAIAANWHYTILVDAGSSGSKLHVFQYDTSASVPVIQDISQKSNKLPLASYASTPENAGPSLKALLDDGQKTLQNLHINPQSVSISILGTAGMRSISQQDQDQIYTNIQAYLKQSYTFPIDRIATISGQMEGLYDWLDVNYLAGAFQSESTTLGSLDMGGASTEIAFQTEAFNQPNDEIKLRIAERTYIIYSKSFLGLGQDQARDTIHATDSASACYPEDYIDATGLVGHFDYSRCQQVYDQWIQKTITEPVLTILPAQHFIAFSGAYYNYHFFGVDQTPDKTIVENRIQQVCHGNWSQLQAEYPNESEAYLSTYCANSTYITDLYYNHYGLTGDQLTVSNAIQAHSIDWTLGALMYELLQPRQVVSGYSLENHG